MTKAATTAKKARAGLFENSVSRLSWRAIEHSTCFVAIHVTSSDLQAESGAIGADFFTTSIRRPKVSAGFEGRFLPLCCVSLRG